LMPQGLLERVHKLRTSSCGLVFLTGPEPEASLPLHELWLLLALMLPDAIQAVHEVVHELQQVLSGPSATAPHYHSPSMHCWGEHGGAKASNFCPAAVMEDVVQRLRAVAKRFVLCRRAEQMDLAERRNRTVEVNLYDFFASEAAAAPPC